MSEKNPDLEMLRLNRESGYNWRERRHEDWTENYTLYRDKVVVNRLTQRQSVNVPLMKQTIRTILKDVDDMPVVYFENLDNDKQAEVFYNEYWKYTAECNRLDLKDIVDKRQVALYGRSFTQLNITDGKVLFEIVDPQDILVDRYVDPTDLDTSRFLIHQHIFRPLASLERNKDYDKEAVEKLKAYFASKQGLIKSSENRESLTEKNERMASMGVSDVDHPILGETYVELTQHLVFRYDDDLKEEVIWLYLEAENQVILRKERLEKIIGETKDNYWRNHYPYESWADDLERTDFWSDGVADVVRTPNKVLNSWFSQLVENRTLRNFNMHYYDATAGGADSQFTPQSYQPTPWGWYGLPGKPSDVLMKAEVADLSDSLDEMNFILNMVERASGATSTQQGVQTPRQITLGEIQLALSEAKQMTQAMSKFYTPSWKSRAHKFVKMVEAAGDRLDAVKIYRKGKNNDDIYARTIEPKDWVTKTGYQVKVWSQDEKQNRDVDKLQRINAVAQSMPDNPKMQEIYKKKLLEFADLSPDEVNEVLGFEREKMDMMEDQALMQDQAMTQPGQVEEPQAPQSEIAAQFGQYQQTPQGA